ncbi:putrescine hydroxycinnamoyltransferase 1-like [Lolium rigidum]|uniref:putrescine hydroxycinnamoyltransferase 1-like n=1 Tax=Lolium rigidum TaxID=89674 RepID=UPI001F5DA40F|nr:putrescine hydroxycinnamoyltransferase 1-like [Lolium rigidum]
MVTEASSRSTSALNTRRKMGVYEEVRVAEWCMLTPSEETPRHGLWLTPIDLSWASTGHTPTVHLYRSDAGGAVDGFFDVARLKAALAKALVAFYPLAGRLGVDTEGRPQIDCAGQGVLFVVAHSALTVDELSSFQPSPELKRLFVPRVEEYSPSLMCGVQVNLLKCGGVALGVAMHHIAVDAIGAFHFFRTWSAFCRDGDAAATALERPCHDRTLLRARSPPVIHPDALTLFCPPKEQQPPSEEPMPSPGAVANQIFTLSKDQVAALKRACTSGASTFCAVSAHVWRCVCAARQLPPDATARLIFPANVRGSVRPPLPDSYFGNGIIMLSVTGKVQDITSGEQLDSVACRIRGAIRRMDDEMVRSAIDYMEIAGSQSQTDAPTGSVPPETDLRVVSWKGTLVYGTDFGWGKPVVVLRAEQPRAGIAYLIDGTDGSMRVLLSAEPATVNGLQHLLYANI